MNDRGRNSVEVVQTTLSCRSRRIALTSTSSASMNCRADDPDKDGLECCNDMQGRAG